MKLGQRFKTHIGGSYAPPFVVDLDPAVPAVTIKVRDADREFVADTTTLEMARFFVAALNEASGVETPKTWPTTDLRP